jgi:hypothetical protein
MIERLDYEEGERLEASLDQFIERRARDREEANVEEEAWKESTRRVNEKRRRANRQAWREYERHLERVHMDLALEHRAKADALSGEGAA